MQHEPANEPGFLVREGDTAGFYPVTNESSDDIMQRFGPYHFTVYAYLLRIIDRNNGKGSRAAEQIAEATSIGQTKVKECLRDLDDSGYLDRRTRTNPLGGPGVPEYTIYRRYQPAARQPARDSSGDSLDSREAATIQELGNTSTNVEGGTPNWFGLFAQRLKEAGLDVTPEDRRTVAGNLKRIEGEADTTEMYAIVSALVLSRIRGYSSSPQQELRFIRGQNRKQVVSSGPRQNSVDSDGWERIN